MSDIFSGLGTAALTGGLNYWMYRDAQKHADKMNANAVQIRAKDLEAAGLSKTLAAGGAAATQTMTPPQFDNPLEGGVLAQSLKQGQRDITKTDEETKRIIAETEAIENQEVRDQEIHEENLKGVRNENKFFEDTYSDRVSLIASDVIHSNRINSNLSITNALADLQLNYEQFMLEFKKVEAELAQEKEVADLDDRRYNALIRRVTYENLKSEQEWYRDKGVPVGSPLNASTAAYGLGHALSHRNGTPNGMRTVVRSGKGTKSGGGKY